MSAKLVLCNPGIRRREANSTSGQQPLVLRCFITWIIDSQYTRESGRTDVRRPVGPLQWSCRRASCQFLSADALDCPVCQPNCERSKFICQYRATHSTTMIDVVKKFPSSIPISPAVSDVNLRHSLTRALYLSSPVSSKNVAQSGSSSSP